jgi:hypothetical protein
LGKRHSFNTHSFISVPMTPWLLHILYPRRSLTDAPYPTSASCSRAWHTLGNNTLFTPDVHYSTFFTLVIRYPTFFNQHSFSCSKAWHTSATLQSFSATIRHSLPNVLYTMFITLFQDLAHPGNTTVITINVHHSTFTTQRSLPHTRSSVPGLAHPGNNTIITPRRSLLDILYSTLAREVGP